MDIVGIDEVGRGPWAGPLVASAVILSRPVLGLNDSKKLSLKQREELTTKIRENSTAVGIGWVHAPHIDRIGLTKATKLAMSKALEMLGPASHRLPIVIDGNYNYLPEQELAKFEIKADGKYDAVSAASIVAKVMRDRFMGLMAQKYPGYGFDSHVGYGTADHKAALQKLGLTPLHRKSFRPVAEIAGVNV